MGNISKIIMPDNTEYDIKDNATYTKDEIDAIINNLPEPMIFRGSLGQDGTIAALPIDGAASVGDVYKVITDGTYASERACIGDIFICNEKTSSSNSWVLIPSGDESSSGSITNIATGTGLIGGPITTTGTIKAKLKSEVPINTQSTIPSNNQYVFAIGVDADGYLVCNTPIMSTTSAGLAPIGESVSNQTQNTKFLRSDGVWTVPSYTQNTDMYVLQTETDLYHNYPILMSYEDSSDLTDYSASVRKNTDFYYNPVTENLHTRYINGIELGSAAAKDWTDTINGANTDLVTNKAVNDAIGDILSPVTLTDIDTISKTTVFLGSNGTWTGCDWVGVQFGSEVASSGASNNAFQLVSVANDTQHRQLLFRMNDDSNGWTSWENIAFLSDLGTAAAKDVPSSGNASSTQVVMGNDSRLTDSRNAADVYSWAKASTKPSYNKSEISGLGTAAGKDYTTTVSSGSSDLITSGAVYTELDKKMPITSFTKSQITTSTTLTDTGLSYTTTSNKAVRITISAYYNNNKPQEIQLLNSAGTVCYAYAVKDNAISIPGALTATCIVGTGGSTTLVFKAKYDGTNKNYVSMLVEALE